MKKKLTAVVLSLVLALSSTGTLQVRAADTTGQEAAPVQEEAEAGQAETIAENASKGEAEQAETADVQDDIAQPDENGDISGAAAAEAAAAAEDPAEEGSGAGEEEDAFLADSAESLAEEEDAADALEAGNAVDSGSCGDHVKWTLTGTGNNLTLTFSGSGPMEEYWMNETPWASYRDRIKKVIVEDGITEVGVFACYSFSRLTDVSLPDTLTCISVAAFEDCEALRTISIPVNVTEISASAFAGCSSLTSVNIPYGVSMMEASVFSDCSSLTDITIPESVTRIMEDAFYGCSSLSTITIPESVTEIDYGVFEGCDSLKRINISDWEKWYNIEFGGQTKLHGDLYVNGKKLTEVVIQDGETEISSGPLSGITSIKKVTIPDSVIYIWDYAFEECSGLETVDMPDSLSLIGEYAFSGCGSLTDITIPAGVKTIREGAFSECGSLTDITVPDSVTSLEGGVFPGSYEDSADFIVFTHNPYVKKICRLSKAAYFDKTAPSIAKITSHNGSDIRVHFDKTDDSLNLEDILEPDELLMREDFPEEGYISGYQIKYADNKSMKGAKSIILKDKKGSSKVITGLQNGKTYYVQAQHYLKQNEKTRWSKWSQVKSVTVGQDPYPTNIEKLSAYIGSHIRADWPKTAGASGYHIKYADNSSMDGAKEVFVKGNSTFTKTLTGLKNGKTYYVKIQTYRTVSGKTSWSPWSKAKSIKVDQTPYGSSIKKLTKVSAAQMKVTWDKAPSASGYHIQYKYYDDDKDPVQKDIYISGNGTLTKTVAGLRKNRNYSVRIQTYRKVSGKTFWSSWSKWKQIKM